MYEAHAKRRILANLTLNDAVLGSFLAVATVLIMFMYWNAFKTLA